MVLSCWDLGQYFVGIGDNTQLFREFLFLAGNYTCEVEWSGEPKQIVHYLEIQGCPIDE